MTLFSLVRDLETLESCSRSPSSLRLANRIFQSALAMRETATEEQDSAILALLERLCRSHPEPRLVIREVSHLLFENNSADEGELNRRFHYLVWGAELMDGDCIHMLALAYRIGHGTPINLEEAIRNYRYLYYRYVDSPEEVRSDAGMALVGILSSREGLLDLDEELKRQRVEEAIRICDDLRRFELNGVRSALYLGAILRRENEGVPADPQRAWNVYLDATRFRGSGEVFYELGTMAEEGEGIGDGNLRLAYHYFQLAVANGYNSASVDVSDMRGLLENEQD